LSDDREAGRGERGAGTGECGADRSKGGKVLVGRWARRSKPVTTRKYRGDRKGKRKKEKKKKQGGGGSRGFG